MAKKEGEFEADFIFSRFPRGCCGDVSSLLGQYLLENNIAENILAGTFEIQPNSSFEEIARTLGALR